MASTPETNIKILKVPLEISNKHQLTFKNKEEQFEYFNSCPKIEIEQANYQRKDNILFFPAHIDSIIEFNYCIYQNSNYGNKWFYAYITNMEYENNGTTKVYLTTDVFQTWQFDIIFNKSFIERQMIDVGKDVPGANLIPEGFELGEPKINNTFSGGDLTPIPAIAYSHNEIPTDKGTGKVTIGSGTKINDMVSPVSFIICETMTQFKNMNEVINFSGYGEYIVCAFTIPKFSVRGFFTNDRKIGTEYTAYALTRNDLVQTPLDLTDILPLPNRLDNYVPVNQKLRTYPYIYLGFNAPNGSSKIYRYENFVNNKPEFEVVSEVNPNPNIFYIPKNYNGLASTNMGDSSSLGGFPLLSTKTNYFNAWLNQNSNIIQLNNQQEQFNYQVDTIKAGTSGVNNILGNLLKPSLSGVLSGITGAIDTGLEISSLDTNHEFYIKQQLAQIEKQKLMPDKVSMSSSNQTLLMFNLLQGSPIFYCYSIRREFAKRIDDFFSMYGYLTNEVDIPNLNNRPNWNYVKTIGANITGNIPQLDLQTIKTMFDNGVTLWHNPKNFLDYSKNNR